MSAFLSDPRLLPLAGLGLLALVKSRIGSSARMGGMAPSLEAPYCFNLVKSKTKADAEAAVFEMTRKFWGRRLSSRVIHSTSMTREVVLDEPVLLVVRAEAPRLAWLEIDGIPFVLNSLVAVDFYAEPGREVRAKLQQDFPGGAGMYVQGPWAQIEHSETP